jgi:hypothetical protein
MYKGGRTGHDRDKPRYDKFKVERVDGRAHLHVGCDYFVLDLTHDKFARPAIEAYITACKDEFPALAADLQKTLDA